MNWELKSLSIEFMEWGEYKGKFAGKISFQNGNKDAFTFALSDEETKEYLALIAKKVGMHAGQLGEQIIESLKALPSSDLIQIQPSTIASNK